MDTFSFNWKPIKIIPSTRAFFCRIRLSTRQRWKQCEQGFAHGGRHWAAAPDTYAKAATSARHFENIKDKIKKNR